LNGHESINQKLSEELLGAANNIIAEKAGLERTLDEISALLHSSVDYYQWVGFYMTDETDRNKLILGPYRGAPTVHTSIDFGVGICGQVADDKDTRIVQDVSKEGNYLSCSIDVKSEIVVPIRDKDGATRGMLDIDSHELEPFHEGDRQLLEDICRLLEHEFFR